MIYLSLVIFVPVLYNLLICSFVSLCHLCNGEVLFNKCSASCSFNAFNVSHCCYHLINIVHQISSCAVLNYFRCSTATKCNNRSTGCLCLYHYKAKWFFPLDRIKKRFCIAKQFCFFRKSYVLIKNNLLVVNMRLYFFFKIRYVF